MGLPGAMGYRGESGPVGPNGRQGMPVSTIVWPALSELFNPVAIFLCFAAASSPPPVYQANNNEDDYSAY